MPHPARAARTQRNPPDPAPTPAAPLGPRPLALHCLIATSFFTSSIAASAAWKTGSLSWNPALSDRARALESDLQGVPDKDFRNALDRAGRADLAAMLAGIEAWRAFPRPARPPAPPVLASEGTTRLMDYGHGKGQPVLVVPSLINRAHVLDLLPDNSLLRHLAAQGLRPLLVDWDAPGVEERGFDTAAYVARLARLLIIARQAGDGAPVPVLGYCMGGTLAVGLACVARGDVARLALLAAPWDFHAGPDGWRGRALAAWAALQDPIWQALGEVPVDALQTCFAGLDPFLAMRKFARFSAMDPESAQAHAFVALEDWLNDGVPMALPTARDAMLGWYGRNDPASGAWRIGDVTVAPQALDIPALALIPAQDRIVPPESALALAQALPEAQVLTPASGHIGMVVGRGMREAVWDPLARFMMT
jgi:polyhydroxyalkanoate synthase